MVALALFVIFIIYGTLIPFSFCESSSCFSRNINSIVWTPFIDPDGSRASLSDVVQNLLFFLPLGFLGLLASRQPTTVNLCKVCLFGALLSCFVEGAQLTTTDRTASITDVITNTTGTFLGAIAVLFFLRASPRILSAHNHHKLQNDKQFFLLIIAAGVTAAGSLQPFDFTLDVSAIISNIKHLLNVPLGLTGTLKDEITVGFRFFLLSSVLVYWLREHQIENYLLKGFVISCIFGLTLEASQMIIHSRYASLQDALLIVFTCFLGSLFIGNTPSMATRNSIPTSWIVGTVIITVCGAAIQNLSPFETNHECNNINWIPFLPYYERTSFIALSNFIESILIYFPLGFSLQLVAKNSRISIKACALSLLVSTAVELPQGCIVGRFPDITDIIGALVGTVLACKVCLVYKRR